MLRRFIRPAAALGAVAASLAFTTSALAAPSTPHLAPIAGYVCGSSINASWTASTPDPGAQVLAYRIDLGDLSTGTASWKYVHALSAPVGGLVSGHHYAIRVRALEITSSNQLVYSASSADSFTRLCLVLPETRQYVAYNPWPGCIYCGGLEDLYGDDPIMERRLAVATLPAAERIRGLEIEPGGVTTVVTG